VSHIVIVFGHKYNHLILEKVFHSVVGLGDKCICTSTKVVWCGFPYEFKYT